MGLSDPLMRWATKQQSGTGLEEVTLDRLVPYNEFNYGEKMILGLILARSFLDMLGTGWFPDEWEMKDISVFRNKSKNDEITIRRPYLSTDFRKHALANSARGSHAP